MKYSIVRIDIQLEIVNFVYASSNADCDVPELMAELHTNVDHIIQSCGFTPARSIDTHLSRRNGGWSYYDTYIYEGSEGKVKLIINVRTSNHPSKPNLETRNNNRIRSIKKDLLPIIEEDVENIDDTPVEVIDTYYKEQDWGAQYYIGKNNNYSAPVDSIDKLDDILMGQLEKLKSRYS